MRPNRISTTRIRASSSSTAAIICICLFLAKISVLTLAAETSCVASDAASYKENLVHEERINKIELILADDHKALDPTLPGSIAEIKKRGGHRCWHKHNTFLEHLLGVHNIIRLWGENEIAGRVGLLHSAYSNSYVNLALFDPTEPSEREVMKEMIGDEAEEIVHLFCIIDRQSVVVDTLLKNGFIPQNGLDVPHLRDEKVNVHLTAETLRLLVIFTMADTSDQYFGWQDDLFGGKGEERWGNSMLLPGEDDVTQHDSHALWPGPSRPGLWMNYISKLGKVARTFQAKDESIGIGGANMNDVVPPVFNDCTEVLSREDEAAAIDLYWNIISHSDSISSQNIIEKLEMSTKLNPWFFEGHVLLAQKYLHMKDHVKAKVSAQRALELQIDWGTAYDKRMSFPAWVAWTRVLHARAVNEEGWPSNSWDVNNFGMVQPL